MDGAAVVSLRLRLAGEESTLAIIVGRRQTVAPEPAGSPGHTGRPLSTPNLRATRGWQGESPKNHDSRDS